MDKMSQYQKIINARRRLLVLFIGFPFVVIFASFLTANENYIMVVAAFWGMLFLVSGFMLMAINNCPWCLKPFLYKVDNMTVMLTQKGNWLTCKKCAYCGEPNVK